MLLGLTWPGLMVLLPMVPGLWGAWGHRGARGLRAQGPLWGSLFGLERWVCTSHHWPLDPCQLISVSRGWRGTGFTKRESHCIQRASPCQDLSSPGCRMQAALVLGWLAPSPGGALVPRTWAGAPGACPHPQGIGRGQPPGVVTGCSSQRCWVPERTSSAAFWGRRPPCC